MQTTIKQKLSMIKDCVNQELSEVDSLIKLQLDSPILLIRQVVSHLLTSHGKRLRPLVVLLAAKACGSCKDTEMIELATIIEFVHSATLLHDDVVDDSDRRRGLQTANSVFGNQASVLIGDFLYSRSFQLLTQRGHIAIMRCLATTTNAIAEGEVMQLMYQFETALTEQQYYDVIYRKTAILFESSAEIGAMLASNDKSTHQMMAQYGNHLGMAFQIIDDILDYTADTEQLGKNIGDDLSSGKLTLPLIIALQRTDHATQIRINNWIKHGNISHINTILEVMDTTQSLDYCLQQAQHHIQQAQRCIADLATSPYKKALLDLANFSLTRNY